MNLAAGADKSGRRGARPEWLPCGGSSCGCGCCAGWGHTWRTGQLAGGAPGAGRRGERARHAGVAGVSPPGTRCLPFLKRIKGGRGVGEEGSRGRRRGRAVAGGAARRRGRAGFTCPPALQVRRSFGVVACFAWTHRDRGHLQMGCVTAGEYAKMRRFDYFLYINSNLNEGPSYTDYKM